MTCHHHHHWAAVVSCGWAKASAFRLQITLSCAVLCHIVSLQYLSRSSLHRLSGLPCRLFLSYGLQVVTREVHRSSLRRLICPAQDHFIFLSVLIIKSIYAFVLSLTQMLVFLSLYVMLIILLSIFHYLVVTCNFQKKYDRNSRLQYFQISLQVPGHVLHTILSWRGTASRL